MFDVNKILTALQTDPNARRTAMASGGGLAAGFAASMLMGKSGRKMVSKAAKYGAVAAIGGLAYHAWRKSQQNKTGSTSAMPTEYEAAPPNSNFLPAPADEAAVHDLGRTLVRAMIAAAKADGKIDADEKTRIFERLEDMELTAEDKAFVFDELSTPLDIHAVVADVKTPEHAAEIYAASVVAIEADTAVERAYLETLAARLGLDPDLVTEIHKTAGAQPAQKSSD